MRTININLLHSIEDKQIKRRKSDNDNVPIDSKTKLISFILLGSGFALFSSSLLAFVLMNNGVKDNERNIAGLKGDNKKLKNEEKDLKKYSTALKDEKNILVLKKIGLKKVKNRFIPWTAVFSDLTHNLPRNVALSNISKKSKAKGPNSLEVTGKIFIKDKKKNNTFEVISYLILNINNKMINDSLLTNARINSISFNEEEKSYTFSIAANVLKPKTKEVIDVNLKKKKENKVGK